MLMHARPVVIGSLKRMRIRMALLVGEQYILPQR